MTTPYGAAYATLPQPGATGAFNGLTNLQYQNAAANGLQEARLQ